MSDTKELEERLPTTLRDRLLARAAMFRRAGEARMTNGNEQIRSRPTDHIPIADDIEAVVGIVDQLGARCDEYAEALDGNRMRGALKRIRDFPFDDDEKIKHAIVAIAKEGLAEHD